MPQFRGYFASSDAAGEVEFEFVHEFEFDYEFDFDFEFDYEFDFDLDLEDEQRLEMLTFHIASQFQQFQLKYSKRLLFSEFFSTTFGY